MSLERQMSSYNAGARGGLPTGTSAEEMAAYDAGAASRGGGSTLGGMGVMLLIPALLLALPALVVGTCLFPLAGILTLVTGSLIAGLLDDTRLAFLMVLAVVLVPCICVFLWSLALEKWVERFRTYRAIRHGARLLVVGFVVHVVVFGFTGAGSFSPNGSFLDRISLLHVLLVAAGMVAAHFASRRLDSRLGDVDGFRARFRLGRRRAA